MGFDLITSALTIDAESRCVWSKYTLRCHINQDLANMCTKPTIKINADSFLETISPVCLPPSQSEDNVEDTSETMIHDEVPNLLLMACCPLESDTATLHLLESEESDTSVLSLLESPSLPAIKAGIQVSESSTIHVSPDYSCSCTDMLRCNVGHNVNSSIQGTSTRTVSFV